MLGHPQLPFREFESYLATVTRLLRGEEAELTARGRTSVVQLQMAHLGFVEVDPPVPVVVSAFGPRTLALAGRLGDGLVTAVPSPGRAARVRAVVEAGAADAGRQLDGSFPVTAMGHVVVLEPGEDVGSERVRAAMATTVLGSLHFAYENWRETGGGEPPAPWASVWDEYTAMVEAEPARTRHLRIHAGHSTYVHPDEWRFVTRDTIASAALVGEPAAILDRIAALEAAGVDELLLLPPLNLWYPEIERFARLVLEPHRG
jgi:alkanesulfonate monooxygenase SsuD/methylene tetrahydromethanopterin reductase-like flavin-dependent oxidoreductase (luciferase family)